MTARHRGAERIHSRWRPAPAAVGPSAAGGPEPEPLLERELDEPQALDQPDARPRRACALIAVAVIAVATLTGAAVIAVQQQDRRASGISLPSTPGQWVEQWTAASIDDPGRVCGQLFAPALAAAFKPDTGRSCLAYYNEVTSRSFRIRHVLEDGPTATVEAQQVGAGRKWGYFTMILSHLASGWQAIDIVPGGPVRPR